MDAIAAIDLRTLATENSTIIKIEQYSVKVPPKSLFSSKCYFQQHPHYVPNEQLFEQLVS